MAKWTPGMPSPNPSGRPKGIIDKRMRLNQALLDDADALLAAIRAAALVDGDVQAQALLLSRIMPVMKAEVGRVQFEFDAKARLADQLAQILQGIADGHLSVDVAGQIIAAATALANARAAEKGGESDKDRELIEVFKQFAQSVDPIRK